MAKNRKITVKFPDGTTGVRRSPREYICAVIGLGPDYKSPTRVNGSLEHLNPTKWQVIGWSVSFDNARARAKREAKSTWGSANFYREFSGRLVYDQVHVVPTDLWFEEEDADEVAELRKAALSQGQP